ncbi:MAG: inosine monophosphate cyclohydrolase [Anaerolineae bacterium]|nr:inosine monophosphate cyclohydrolase [Anaerolineae bacterium]
MQPTELATQNFETSLRANPYPGRGLVIGRSSESDWIILYWIMGRSAQSRNRRFVADGQTLRTEPIDAALVIDPSLIIYEAMLDLPDVYLVSNGDQTRTVFDALNAGTSFDAALSTREREPDSPNFTPRITGMLDLRKPSAQITLSMLKANPIDPMLTDRYTFSLATPAVGFGYGLTTYRGDGSPLPSFSGDPLLLPCEGNTYALLDRYWDALNADNRISLALKHISASGEVELLIRNRE